MYCSLCDNNKFQLEMGTTENYEDVSNSEEKQIFIQPTTVQESSLQTQKFSYSQLQTPIPPESNNSSSTADEYIKFGSYITLQHHTTSKHLSSRSPDSNELSTKGNKDQVFAARRKSSNELWIVLQAYGERRRLKMDDAVPYNSQIRLVHIVSRRNLRSHPDYISPISKQQEVICHGDENTSDLNDNWLVQRHSYTNHYDNSGYWLANDAITLRHIQTGATLHSHSIMLDDDNQEVTCYGPGHEENDKWKAERIKNINDFIRNNS
uniref:Stromal cell-derived factor 2-like protein n=1 Tax=Anthurium amnicola TaxID=1678845 RepID=A0A1D1Z2I4_9ARAE